jgi:cytochrome c biogenesis protein CcmG/thiol:disulfide interchange protein DsbE
MRRNLILVIAALLAIVSVTLALDTRTKPPAAHFSDYPEISKLKTQPAPDFSFKVLGSTASQNLSDFKGKVVLLNFWASWCAPCVIEFPKLQTLAQTHKDNLVVLALSADTEAEAIERFLKKIRHQDQDNFLIVHDVNKIISQDLFQTIRLPESIIIDPNGQMVRKIAGDTDWTGEAMNAFLSELIDTQDGP